MYPVEVAQPKLHRYERIPRGYLVLHGVDYVERLTGNDGGGIRSRP